MRARLIPVDGGPALDLVKDLTLVGRDEGCDLFIDHKSVSKQHCVLVKTEGLVLVRDLGSTNGTRVNGQRIRRAALLPNDNLAIANFKYHVKFGEGIDGPKEAENGKKKEGEVPIKVNALPDNYSSS
ncbi:MAG: FHA domain-containing protein [Gemmataceae bacterium]|nr:FHA domain-containing protein [Gemmataceae bacterium]